MDAAAPVSQSCSMLARLADRIGSHPRRTLAATLVFVVIAGAIGGPVAGKLDHSGGFTTDDSGSARASDRIEAATGVESGPAVVLLVEGRSGERPSLDRLGRLARELSAVRGVAVVGGAGREPEGPLLNTDGSKAVVLGTLAADADEDAVVEAVEDRFAEEEDVTIGGGLFADTQVGDTVGEDLARAELLALPILVLLSLLFFRGRAAVMPLIVGLTTILGTFLILTAVNQVYGLSIFALNLVIGLGLGLAIDYTLFLVTRYREELASRGEGPAAIRATLMSAGRTVVFSALTVAVALITLTLFPLGFLRSMGVAGATVALVAATAALVISPALFGLWGERLLTRRRRERPEREGRWYRLSQLVMRRPATVAALTGALMLALALPALRAVWTPIDSSVIPTDKSARVVADALETEFAGNDTNPVTLVIEAPARAEAKVRDYAAGVADETGVRALGAPRALDDSSWQIDVTVAGEPEGEVAQALVDRVRADGAPYPVLVGGEAAEFVDQQDAIGSRLPLAVGLLVLLTFCVLWLMTGSLVLPLKAIAMNALTVGSALGLLTWIYQDGRLEDVLGYTANGGIEPTDFLVTAAVVFALSTDYGVFLLGRIKEARDGGAGEREAVAIGLQRTGAVITAAAILLAVAIGAFSTSSISFIQQVGLASAFGVLVDAFIVRTFLVPSLMAVLGRWNWWSPSALRRLHQRIGPGVPHTYEN